MFYIDPFNQDRDEDMSFEEAVRIVNSKNRDQGLLENMKDLEKLLLQVRDEHDEWDMLDEFYWDWHYEINAFNKVFEGMSKLFAPAEAA